MSSFLPRNLPADLVEQGDTAAQVSEASLATKTKLSRRGAASAGRFRHTFSVKAAHRQHMLWLEECRLDGVERVNVGATQAAVTWSRATVSVRCPQGGTGHLTVGRVEEGEEGRRYHREKM